jgi:hypothetical protein
VAAAAVVVGAGSLAVSGMAGASASHPAASASRAVRHRPTDSVAGAERFFTCRRVQLRSDQLQRIRFRFSQDAAALDASKKAARAAHRASLVASLQKEAVAKKADESYLLWYTQRLFNHRKRYAAWILAHHGLEARAHTAELAMAGCRVVPLTLPTAVAPTAPGARPAGVTTGGEAAPGAAPTTTSATPTPTATTPPTTTTAPPTTTTAPPTTTTAPPTTTTAPPESPPSPATGPPSPAPSIS